MKSNEIVGKIRALVYPKSVSEPTLSSRNPSIEQVDEYKKKMEEYLANKESYIQQREAYHAAFSDLWGQWRDALYEEYAGHLPTKVFVKLFEKAYNDTHGEGYAAVADSLEDLVCFVDEIIAAMGDRK